jgi:hypothetical protein
MGMIPRTWNGSRGTRSGGRRAAAALVLFLALHLAQTGIVQAQANEYNSLSTVWTAPGDDGETGSVTSYELFYDTIPPGADLTAWWNAVPFSQRITLLPPLASAGQLDSTRIAGLSQGTTYYIVLVARDEAANPSNYSNVASGTTKSCGAPASTPSSFSADVDPGGVLVTWDAASEPAARSLHIYRAAGSAPAWTLVQSLSTTATTYLDSQTAPGTTYRYRATWAGPDIDGVACEGPYTPQAVVTVPGPLAGSSPIGSGTLHAYPNPASDRVQVAINVTASAPLAVRLRVFDLSGRWLATVAEGTFPPGKSVITWNRTGRTGLKVAPGYYELIGTIGSSRARERLVLLP